MNFKTIFAIAKKELFSFLNSPLAYIITVPFLVVATFLYFRVALMTGEASLRPFFELLPWFFLLLAPALSMRLLTNEQKEGTLELLISHPVRETEIILGKFFGSLAFFLIILGLTISLPITLFVFSKPDIGMIIGQYSGAVFVFSAFLAIGLMVSAHVNNATASFLASAFFNLVFILVGLEVIVLMIPQPFDAIVSQLGILTHVSNLARGLIDFRDMIYFLSLTVILLTAAVIKLAAQRLTEDKKAKTKLNLALFLLIILAVGLNVFFSQFSWRLDLTREKIFSLAPGTKKTLRELPDKVTIKFYSSQDLPASIQPVAKRVEDILKDYQRYGEKIELKALNPDLDQEAASAAQEEGVREVAFNRLGVSRFEVQTGFLGLTVQFQDGKETIPFVEKTDDLEYQLTRLIRKLTNEEEKTVGIVNLGGFSQDEILRQALASQYTIKDVSLKKEDLEGVNSLLVIDSGQSEEATAAAALKEFLDNKGKALILSRGVQIDPQFLNPEKSQSAVSQVLTDYGVTVNADLVYDLQLSETISLGSGNVRYFLPYPFWTKALVGENDFNLQGAEGTTLPWPSSLSWNKKRG